VGSRIFGLFIDGNKTDILAPFADMLNHRLPKQTTWNYLDGKEGFVIESLQDIDQGVEVFDSYGKKCNSRYLLNYGFVVDDNPDNQVVPFLLLSASRLNSMKRLSKRKWRCYIGIKAGRYLKCQRTSLAIVSMRPWDFYGSRRSTTLHSWQF
jgi:hypothetical protein